MSGPVAQIGMAESIFFSSSAGGALTRRCVSGRRRTRLPLGLALPHGETGITLDPVLMGEEDLAILFSFTRSHFRVDDARP